jgi:hypothetical protein
MARKKLSAPEIEKLVLEALRRRPGLKGLEWAKIRPSTEESWTWELAGVGPDGGKKALGDAMDAVQQLRQEIDLGG